MPFARKKLVKNAVKISVQKFVVKKTLDLKEDFAYQNENKSAKSSKRNIMAKELIIVESPAKVKTIKKFLGPGTAVLASVGHIRDLPKKTIGVDEENDFAPQYQIIEGKEKIVRDLQQAAAKVDTVYLAPDPDREGEAIAWHIAELIKENSGESSGKKKKSPLIKRIQFNEITKNAVKEAIASPRDLNEDLFEAQQARRVLDRLVGYKVSPLLWNKVKRGISAGRVQSVALRLIVEREEARYAFVPEEYWLFKALVQVDDQVDKQADTDASLKLELYKIEGKKAHVPNEEAAIALEEAIKGQDFVVTKLEEKERQRSPQAPFITSSLQQSASQRLGYPAKRTMQVAQRLYEGVDIGERGITALITYMRTDSVRIADEAKKAAAAYIEERFGKEFLPKGGKGRDFKGKKGAQDAHEAIRPVDVSITPDEIKPYVDPAQFQVYKLIWQRFVASQMAAARFHDTVVTIDSGIAQWRIKGERLLFSGFLAIMSSKEENVLLPPLKEGQILALQSLHKEQKFTQPPARFSEASLVRELEELGIGRPSTYASIISTLQDREYVRLEEKHFVPSDLGRIVTEHLRTHFVKLMNVDFTAEMENALDSVAEGKESWVGLLQNFTAEFNPTLAEAAKAMGQVKAGMEAGIDCPECEKPLMLKFGKAGEFLACSGYPECTFTSNYRRNETGEVEIVERPKEELKKVGECPLCSSDLVVRKSRTGSRFIACTGYPDCKYAAPYSTDVLCPSTGSEGNPCGGSLVEKSSKRGKIFYACDSYPKCDYALWDWPIDEPCPQCSSPLLVRKNTKARGEHIACPVKTCKYVRVIEDSE